jgi:hypothetical protein
MSFSAPVVEEVVHDVYDTVDSLKVDGAGLLEDIVEMVAASG